MTDKLKSAQDIPFFDRSEGFINTLKNSSKHRGYSPIYFIFRKLRNILLYRIAFFCPFNTFRIKMHRWRGVHIGERCFIDQMVRIDNAYPEYVYIGDNVGITQGVTILAHTNVKEHFEGVVQCAVQPVVIDDNALISINSTLLPGVKVGKSAIVSAGAVVAKDVPNYTLTCGRKIRKDFCFESLLKNKK